MDEKKPSFEKIDALSKEFNRIFSNLQAHITKIEMNLRSVELEYMYGNIGELAYLEKKQEINQKISDFFNMLLELQKAENSL
jgi:hypothetical protein